MCFPFFTFSLFYICMLYWFVFRSLWRINVLIIIFPIRVSGIYLTDEIGYMLCGNVVYCVGRSQCQRYQLNNVPCRGTIPQSGPSLLEQAKAGLLVDPWFRHHLKSDRARRHCDSRGRSELWIVHEFPLGIKQRTTDVTSSRSRSRSVCQGTRRKEEPDESR